MFTRRMFMVLLVLVAGSSFASAAQKAGGFEIYADAKGEFRWRFIDAEEKNLATSGQGYVRKADCKKMCENFASDISKYTIEVYESKDGYRWRINAKNGNNVGASNFGYKTKAEAEKSVAQFQSAVKKAKITEKESDK